MWQKRKTYIVGIIIPLVVGGVAAFLTRSNVAIYEQINRPALSPPGFLFPIVWTILYVLMGISSARIYFKLKQADHFTSFALYSYAKQLLLNFLWSIIFFNLQHFFFAFIWLVFLWFSILRMILVFYRIDRLSAYLQIPYLIWVTFAGYLNLAIDLLNP